jgi:hypothetical protein
MMKALRYVALPTPVATRQDCGRQGIAFSETTLVSERKGVVMTEPLTED